VLGKGEWIGGERFEECSLLRRLCQGMDPPSLECFPVVPRSGLVEGFAPHATASMYGAISAPERKTPPPPAPQPQCGSCLSNFLLSPILSLRTHRAIHLPHSGVFGAAYQKVFFRSLFSLPPISRVEFLRSCEYFRR